MQVNFTAKRLLRETLDFELEVPDGSSPDEIEAIGHKHADSLHDKDWEQEFHVVDMTIDFDSPEGVG